MNWAVAKTFPRREERARTSLDSIGISSYLPKCLLSFIANGRAQKKTLALFPGYLFIKIADHWKDIFGLSDVNGMIMSGENPSLVKSSVIDELKARENSSGLIVVDNLPRRRRFRRGQRVRVANGVLSGQEVKFEFWVGKELVRTRFDMFGRSTLVTMKVDELIEI